MGEFGGEHHDYGDSAGHFTTMISLSRLPESYDPGCFFILYLGIYVTLDNFATVSFSGLRRHGSTAPYRPQEPMQPSSNRPSGSPPSVILQR